jgi:hypothetical protein
MANNNTSDYKIVLIDSSNVFYTNNNTNNFDFYIKFNDPLKDVYKIKILYDAVSFPKTQLVPPSDTNNLDHIYVNLNNYDRVRSFIIDPNTKKQNSLNYFDSIMIDKCKIKDITGISDTTMFNDFNENEGDFYLNPVESQFNRLNIQLFDKNNNIINKTFINRFVMKLCIYYYTKKVSQF